MADNKSQSQMLATLIAMADVIIDRPPKMHVEIVALSALRCALCRARDNNDPYDGIVRDEAVLLAQALMNILCAREDLRAEAEIRWTAIAGALRPFVRTDLAKVQAAAE